jgi:hypothetical protein
LSGEDWGRLVKRAPRARPLESSVVKEIREALAKLPYVACWRNSAGHLKDVNGTGVTYGLAPGASDLILAVTLDPGLFSPAHYRVARMVGLEAKRDEKEGPTDEQLEWGRILAGLGGYWACVWSADMAIDAVERARRGEPGGP